METRTGSIAEWIAYNLEKEKEDKAPLSFCLTGRSMLPLLRPKIDRIMVMPLSRPVKKGDIVLFHQKNYCGEYILHRVIACKDHAVLTQGDGNPKPDGWIDRSQICGIAVGVERGKRSLNLQGFWLRLYGKVWMLTAGIRRPLLHLCSQLARLGKKMQTSTEN